MPEVLFELTENIYLNLLIKKNQKPKNTIEEVFDLLLKNMTFAAMPLTIKFSACNIFC